MDYHLEREIRLSEEPEHKALYKWSLQEYDSDGNKIGRDQIPWQWSLCFTASELRLTKEIKIEKKYKSIFHEEDNKNDDEEKKIAEYFEQITAILHPGICEDGNSLEDETTFSMFGTKRKIQDFKLAIFRVNEEDNEERCHVWGCVSYTTEIDFRYETTDDTVYINLWLSPEKFNHLSEVIKNKKADLVQIYIGGASGFYSEWSPSISTNNIKILTNHDHQKIISSENCHIKPNKLGEVDEFRLSIIQRNKLNLKQDLRSINVNKLFEKQNEVEENNEERFFSQSDPDINSLILAQLSRNEIALAKLRKPLWLIFTILLILSIKFTL